MRRCGYEHKDPGAATGQTLQQTADKEENEQGCNSARYCSDPRGKYTSENISEVMMKMKYPSKKTGT